jgi:tetratricopeptide (TPR) repeat protein
MYKSLVAIALVLLFATPTAAQVEPGHRLCWNFNGLFSPDDQIVGCNAVITFSKHPPQIALALERRGQAFDRKGDFDSALADYEKSLTLDPSSYSIRTARGDTLLKMRAYDRAIADYDENIKRFPKIAASFWGRGSAYYGKADFRRAVADHGKAIELWHTDPKFFYSRALAFNELKEFDRAIADFAQVIALDSGRWDAHYMRARALIAKGDTQKALADLDKTIEMNPSYVWSYTNRGHIYRMAGQLDLAFAELDRATQIAPQEAELKFESGVTRFCKRDFAAAARDFPTTVPTQNRAYAAIFRYLALTRSGEIAIDELQRNSSALDRAAWPYPVIELYIGKRSKAATLALAKTADHRCESRFYVGQWHVLRKEQAQAISEFKAAVGMCTRTMVEYSVALAELKAHERGQ